MDEIRKKWKEYFDTHRWFPDGLILALTGEYSVDVIKLDDWLHLQGYKESEHGSMRDYIALEYGKDAADFVSTHI